ncbi:MAG TPA: AtzH-like domain-containing protein [Kofleriaceae bacterium]|nr:AtzH-like domain-containing protein [Kofleriaceae bacterium]
MARAIPALLLTAVLAACGGGGGAHATSPHAQGAEVDAFAAVFRAVEQWRQGWQVRSLDALEPLYRHDDHTVIVYQGRAQRGWDAAKEWLRNQLASTASVHIRIEDGVVTQLGPDSATFAARMGRDLSDGAVTASDEGFLTLTFVRVDDGWQIVAEHYSFALGGS